MRSPWVAMLVVLALFAPDLAALASTDRHGCTDHVCYCRAPRPDSSRPAAAKPSCHGEAAPAAPADDGCRIRGACRHDVPLLGSLAPFALAVPVVVDHRIAIEQAARPPASPTRGGFHRLDPRPPRLLS